MSRTKAFWDNLCLREQWGARRRNGWGDRSISYPLAFCFLHHDVAGEISENATVEQEKARMRLLEDIGWQRFQGSVSYPLVVFPSGRAYQGLGFSRVGAHTAGYNTPGMAIALVGNYESKRPTAAQERTIALALEAMHEEGILRQARVTHGHRDVFATSCPGGAAYGRIAAINALVGKTDAPAAVQPAATKPAAPKPAAPAASTKPWPAGRGPWPDAYLTVTGNRNEFQDRALFKLLGDAGYDGATLAIRLQKRLRASGDYKGTITAQSQIGPQTIQAWQRFLKARGHYKGSITAQSQWGPQTTRATVDFLNAQAKLYWK